MLEPGELISVGLVSDEELVPAPLGTDGEIGGADAILVLTRSLLFEAPEVEFQFFGYELSQIYLACFLVKDGSIPGH